MSRLACLHLPLQMASSIMANTSRLNRYQPRSSNSLKLMLLTPWVLARTGGGYACGELGLLHLDRRLVPWRRRLLMHHRKPARVGGRGGGKS